MTIAIRAFQAVSTQLTNNPGLVARLASKLNLGSGRATMKGILDAFSAKKGFAAMALWELGAEGQEILDAWAAEDPEIMGQRVSLYGAPADKIAPESDLENIEMFTDELEDIAFAVAKFGSLEAFLRVRRALMFDEKVLVLYTKIKKMGSNL
jgi:hypothetical protein